MRMLKLFAKKILQSLTYKVSPKGSFISDNYQRHNHRRLEHLASLCLNVAGSTVLEVGAGIGDHTSYFLDRGCEIVTTDARYENVKILRTRYPGIKALQLDLDNPSREFKGLFDIVYCYGLLYHLQYPDIAIKFMSECCKKMLLLETCVSFGEQESINICDENEVDTTQAFAGKGCRPTRKWVYNQLKQYFEFVYMPTTQPNHEQFPVDWTKPSCEKNLTRAIFIGAREQLGNCYLTQEIPDKQTRHP